MRTIHALFARQQHVHEHLKIDALVLEAEADEEKQQKQKEESNVDASDKAAVAEAKHEPVRVFLRIFFFFLEEVKLVSTLAYTPACASSHVHIYTHVHKSMHTPRATAHLKANP